MNPDGWKSREALSGENLDAAFSDIVEPMSASLTELEVGDWINVEQYRAGEVVSRRQAVVRRTWTEDGVFKCEFSDPTPDDPRPAEVSITVIGGIR